jgi:hypothetical protein
VSKRRKGNRTRQIPVSVTPPSTKKISAEASVAETPPAPRPFGELEERGERSKVAIVGFTDSRKQAPWDDTDFEIWCLNALFKYKDVRRVTRWFDLHPRERIDQIRIAQYRAFADKGVPVYMREAHDDLPSSEAFPFQSVTDEFGEYFTNSISWQIGLAILMGFEEIHVYGVDMAHDTEYRFQRSNTEYLIGLARGRGITVYIPSSSDLLKATHMYGLQDDQGFRARLIERRTYFINQIKGAQQKMQEIQHKTLIWEGARQNLEWLLQSYCVVDGGSFKSENSPLEPGEVVPQSDGAGEPVSAALATQGDVDDVITAPAPEPEPERQLAVVNADEGD